MSSEYQEEHAAGYAAFLQERFETEGMLAELQQYPNFVVWRYTLIDGQRKKPPFNPNTNLPASPTNADTWGTLEVALHALATGKFQGIGFMLSSSPFSGIDLDHCIEDGTLRPWAQEIIETLDTYTEYSPSWNKETGEGGVHLLVEGKPPTNKKVGNTEIYGEKHYLTITTNHLEDTPLTINSRQQALDALYASLVPVPQSPPEVQNTRGVYGVPLSELPPEAEQDDVLQRLLRGDITGYKSQSSADFVLIMKLLHWTGDNTTLTRALFLQSSLGKREKATRPTGATTYLDMTIHNALRKRRNPPMRR